MTSDVKKRLVVPFKFISIMWIVFILNSILPINLNHFGLVPRTEYGLIGIFTSPFLHANLSHIVNNSIPLFALLAITGAFYGDRMYWILFLNISIGGMLEWLFARSACHIGASGLIYGLVGFLIAYGIFQRKVVPMLLSLGIGLYYGLTMWSGMLPTQASNISWEGHLFGAIGGVITAKILIKNS